MLKLLKDFTEGLKIYLCLVCGHKINIGKGNRAICNYCGNQDIES